MGRMSTEPLELENLDQLVEHLRTEHSAFMSYGENTYYLTDANDIYWRAQDTNQLNEKGHFVDCSQLLPTVTEFVNDPFIPGTDHDHSIAEVFGGVTFYASRKIEGQGTPVQMA